jgi:DNA-binding NarL/FixJ family response regulator
MRVILIDDHKLFRIGLREIIRKSKTIEVVAEYADGKGFFQDPPERPADVALVDINLETENGIQVAREIKKKYPSIRIAMLTMVKDQKVIREAIDAGVDGYFNKDIDAEELIFGIRKISQGGRYFTSGVTQLLLDGLSNTEHNNNETLTDREKQVLQFLVDGYSSQEIGRLLNVGKRTIDGHRANILMKFKVRNTSQLVKMVIEKRLLN